MEAEGWPEWLMMRFADVIPEELGERIFEKWDRTVSLGLMFPKEEKQRSKTPAVHLGGWMLYGSEARITADSLQAGLPEPQRTQVLESMDDMLGDIKAALFPITERIMHHAAPEQERSQAKAHAFMRHWCRETFEKRPNLDFGPLFFTMAIKEGASERIHVDWNDNLRKFALVWVLGNFVGGLFCSSQLGIRVPVRGRSLLAVRTRLLGHNATLVGEGRRLVFTCFTDSVIFEKALEGHDYAYF
ncbi:hypothetical protein B0H15DRAFT_775892 [Mycena belliarum]|uniref:Uncharacterized protein n=1 Tax=Mycena belliarum TaxID=1033014 RepID=A0AAD6XQ01_9AGAR|nr:hypothetical protein B0H15DRAFT_775892 [Mycena belliae]